MKGSILDYQFKSISIKVVKWDSLPINRQLMAYWKVALVEIRVDCGLQAI